MPSSARSECCSGLSHGKEGGGEKKQLYASCVGREGKVHSGKGTFLLSSEPQWSFLLPKHGCWLLACVAGGFFFRRKFSLPGLLLQRENKSGGREAILIRKVCFCSKSREGNKLVTSGPTNSEKQIVQKRYNFP